MIFYINNNFILSKINENKILKETIIINELKKIIPSIDDNIILVDKSS
jgi:hypothetical protein